MTTARVADVYVEAVVKPQIKARTADVHIEIVVSPPKGGWSVGTIKIGG